MRTKEDVETPVLASVLSNTDLKQHKDFSTREMANVPSKANHVSSSAEKIVHEKSYLVGSHVETSKVVREVHKNVPRAFTKDADRDVVIIWS